MHTEDNKPDRHFKILLKSIPIIIDALNLKTQAVPPHSQRATAPLSGLTQTKINENFARIKCAKLLQHSYLNNDLSFNSSSS